MGKVTGGSAMRSRLLAFFFFRFLSPTGYFLSRKKVSKERHLRGEGFRFPSPLKNPHSLKRPKGEGLRPLPFWKPPPRGSCDYQIAPLPHCGKGRWRPLAAVWKYSCREPKNRTALHFRAKAAAGREAETMQYLGEICAAQRSRGKTSEISCGRRRVRKSKNVVFGGVFGYFCRRGQKYPAPGRGTPL